ncbi:MAG: hypothetical protein EBU66_13555 [Bacteroidetes bacterium]|nr:hypothetical protein [bacterium]NBP65672.1 hypothetical protein [Bacteroidota bacterium]
MNIETWYYINRSTPPTNFNEAEDLLNTSIQTTLFSRNNKSSVVKTINSVNYNMIPFHMSTYVIIVSTKVYVTTSGTYTLRFLCTTNSPINLYVQANTNAAVQHTITGNSSSIRTYTLNLNADTKYTFVFYVLDTTLNTSIFLQTQYTGIIAHIVNAYTPQKPESMSLSSSTVVAVGDIKWSVRLEDFDGWLLCDGRQVYRDAYSDLFALIGTSFGAGDGITTFNLPDSRGRVCGMIGAGSGLTYRNLGNLIGTETHTLTVNEIPSHTHTGTTNTSGNHNHAYNDAYFAENRGAGGGMYGTSSSTDYDNDLVWRRPNGGFSTSPVDISTSTNGNHTHTITTNSTGEGDSHNNMQPTVFIGNVFICANI